ncbi:MAG: cation diffusion facilitator family transporter [Gemmatimonadetes bacterium]|nr:cation diffusion facilitator family transporter [Gemmatimonadota bacterium]
MSTAHTHTHTDAHAHGNHGHHGHHGHHHGPASFDRAFAVGIGLNMAFVVAEVVFGIRAHSLALTADAGHNLGDVLGLGLAWAGSMLARARPTERRTYGLRRFSILAALGNAGFLLIAVGAIAVEAVHRLQHPEPVSTGMVMVVALVGIVINVGTAIGFMAGRADDLNIRGAYVHMLGDAAASAGVVVAGLVIAATGWFWLDPAVSLLLIALITIGSWSLLRDSFNLALDAVPQGIDPVEVRQYLMSLAGVTEVHDLHIWGLSTTHVALTAHLVLPEKGDTDALLADACQVLRARFKIDHATMQIERGTEAHPCALAPADVV